MAPEFWKRFALRTAPEITSGDSTVDRQRENIRKIAASVPTIKQGLPMLSDAEGNRYRGMANATQDAQNQKVSCEIEKIGLGSYRGGINFPENKSLAFTHNALYPAGPVNTDDNVFIPRNVLVAFTEDLEPLDEVTNNPTASVWLPNRKLKRVFGKTHHGRIWEGGTGYFNVKSSYAFPFNIMSSSVTTGYNKVVVDRVSSSLEIVNLHHDSYGPDMEIPMQGPFTEHNVGGHQSRHIALNSGSTMDTYLTRPEAWKILLGKCSTTTGAIGIAGPDYPWPEANEDGEIPYPMTGSQKAVYYRDFIAKRPVNIRNITQSFGSSGSILGNYSHNYQVINSVGAFSNPRHFVDHQPALPTPRP